MEDTYIKKLIRQDIEKILRDILNNLEQDEQSHISYRGCLEHGLNQAF